MMIKIYGANGCGTCDLAKKYTRLRKRPFEFIVLENKEAADELKEKAGIKGNLLIPQFFFDDEYIGDYGDYKKWIKQN